MVLFLASALTLGAFGLLSQTANIGAVGAPSDNSTISKSPLGDQVQGEIIPPVNYTLLRHTSQTKSSPPSVIPRFIGASEQEKSTIIGHENWYLHIDINAPGWLYIYEYFPAGAEVSGKWIAYKWQLLQGGVWKLGPFTASTDELEGQHIYQFWFYSDGLWAGGDPMTSENILVYWTYSRGQLAEQPVEPIPPQAPTPSAKETTLLDQLRIFLSQPAVLALAPLVVVCLAVVGLYLYRRYIKEKAIEDTAIVPVGEASENAFAALPSAIASAKIALPNGVELRLVGSSRIIGRGDLARALDLDELELVSRQHFEVKADGGQFYIEDLNSTNGTRLNGVDISGKGAVSLNTDDIIEPAGVIQLKFHFPCQVKAN